MGASAGTLGNFDAPVTALAVSEGGLVAVGLSGGRVAVRSIRRTAAGWTPSSGPRAIADCLFLSEDELAVVDHGYGPGADPFAGALGRGRPRTSVGISRAPARRGS